MTTELEVKAESGDRNAQFELAEKYFSIGSVDDDKKGLELLRKAAEQGHAEAQFEYGCAYFFGICGVEQIDMVKAMEWIRKSAEQGYTKAEFYVGDDYFEQGNAVDAINWLKKAADKEYYYAQLELGVIYQKGMGMGMEKNLTEALVWFKKTAKNGDKGLHSEAHLEVAKAYFYGEGVEIDKEEAERWKKAAYGTSTT